MGFWQKIRDLLGPPPPLDKRLAESIGTAVETVDPILRAVGTLEQQLAGPVGRALAYCERLAAALPPPVAVNRACFALDPLVHSLFASADDIDGLLGTSDALADFLAEGGNAFSEACYGLLVLCRNQKAVLGMGLQGQVLQSDVPQQVLYFSDPELHALSNGEMETRRLLSSAAYRILLRQFADELAGRRRKRDEAHALWAAERAAGSGDMTPDETTWRLGSLDGNYHALTESLAPERIVEQLAQWLETPERHLHLETDRVTVDAMGVLADSGRDDVHTFDCPQLVGHERRRTVLLVRLSCEEARAALSNREQRNRQALQSLFF